MVEHSDVNLKISDLQLNEFKSAIKNQAAETLRMSIKMFNRNNVPHKFLLTTRQTTKLRNETICQLRTMKLSKAQISKIVKAGIFLGSLLIKLADPLVKVAVLLAKKSF